MSITFVLLLCIWGSGKSRTKISHMSTKGYLKGPSQYLGVLRFQPKSCGFSSNYSVAQCGTNTSWTKQEYNFFHYSPPCPCFSSVQPLDNNDWTSIQHDAQWEDSMNKTRLGRMNSGKCAEWSRSLVHPTPRPSRWVRRSNYRPLLAFFFLNDWQQPEAKLFWCLLIWSLIFFLPPKPQKHSRNPE